MQQMATMQGSADREDFLLHKKLFWRPQAYVFPLQILLESQIHYGPNSTPFNIHFSNSYPYKLYFTFKCLHVTKAHAQIIFTQVSWIFRYTFFY